MNRRNNIARSELVRPARLLQTKSSSEHSKIAANEQPDVEFNLLLLLQYLSSSFETDVSIQYVQSSTQGLWTTVGNGRIYVVKQISTGSADEMYDADFFRPSMAQKSLRSFSGSSAHEITSRWRALIQELRILRHRPLAKHPNFPKIIEISWEYDALDLQQALPTIGTEFAVWGTLDSFFLALPEHDWPMKSRLLLDVVEGLSALHSCKIVHGDIKMENILVFPDESDANFPVIAKLSDFGFCVDVSVNDEYQSLLGYTPLWAAPEASHLLKKECLYLTDVYSLGFIIWSVCLGGRKPSEEVLIRIMDKEEGESAWTSLKESDEMLSVAKASLGERSLTMPMHVSEATQYLDWTLRYLPNSRQLNMVLSMLRLKSHKRRAEEIPNEDTYHPLAPLKGNLSLINKFFWESTWMVPSVRQQISNDLVAVAARPETSRSSSMYSPATSNHTSRHPVGTSSKAATALMDLAYKYMTSRNSERSFEKAIHYLNLAAQCELELAQWICLRLKKSPLVNISPEQELEWSKKAAQIGLRPITLDLATFDPQAAQSCHAAYQRSFWALVYGVTDEAISAIFQLEDNAAGTSQHDNQILQSFPSSPLGNTPLHVAALIGRLGPLVVIAKSHLIPVNATNHRGETPLFLACRCGHAAVVDFLLSFGADAGISNKYGASCLHWLDAFEEHDITRIAKSLVRHGNDPNQPAQQDRSFFGDKANLFNGHTVAGTPLHHQVVGGNIKAIEALLSLGSKSDFIVNGWTPIDRAAQFHRSEIIEILLDRAPSFNLNSPAPKTGLAPLHRAITGVDPFLAIYNHSGNHEGALEATLHLLLNRGTLPSELKVNPILFAVSKGARSALEFLLKYQHIHGIDLVRQPRPLKARGAALLDRIFREPHQVMEPRLQIGQADIGGRQVENDLFTYNAVLEAVKYEDEEMLRTLLRYGADPLSLLHYKSHTRFNALHLCTKHMHGGTQIAQLLIDHGVDVNQSASGNSSDTPLCYALQGSQFHLASLFLDNGASLTVCENEAERGNVMGELIYCIPGRSVFNAIQFLAQHPKARSEMPLYIHEGYKTTVFHMICGLSELRRRNWPVANFFPVFALLRKIFPDSLFLDAADISGFTPLHYAIYHAFPEALQALLEAGADPFSQTKPDLSNPLIDSEWISKPRAESGISIFAMVKSECFVKIHAGISDVDRHELNKRREMIKELLSPYTF